MARRTFLPAQRSPDDPTSDPGRQPTWNGPDLADPAMPKPAEGPVAGPPDLSVIPIAGLTRRRVAWIAAAVTLAWIVLAVGRQVGDVAAVNDRAADLSTGNVALEARVERLEDELSLIQRTAYVAQQARAHRLGEVSEIPFTLAPNTPPLPPDAPGSAALAVGAQAEPAPPLERWLELLFGPSG